MNIKLPQEYISSMQELLKDEYAQYEKSFQEESKHGLRINTSKISVKDFLKISPFHLEAVPWTSDGFYYEETDKPAKHPYYYAGLYYLQEPSAMLPAEVLDIEEDDIVLDACAAPGGKTLKLANKINNTGVLISNDLSSSRCKAIINNIERFGIRNCFVTAENINNLTKLNETFDKILIDAPCSGEGMFRKDPSLIKSWLERGNNYYASIQKEIVSKAIPLLKEGGKLVYSTCTFSKKEDEDIIEYILDNFKDMHLLPIKNHELFEKGLTPKTQNCVRLYPHKIKGEGHFVAYLQKDNKQNKNIINHSTCTFKYQNLNVSFNNGEIKEIKEKVYFIPDTSFDISELRIMRSGLLLGEKKKDTIDLSSTLALSMKKEEIDNILDLELDDSRVIKYLKGETITGDGNQDGYILICVKGFPLGFGKVKDNIIKNKYNTNLRWL